MRSNSHVDTYEDFVAWRDDNDGAALTVADAARWFSATPLATLVEWFQRDRAAQETTD